MSNRAGAQRKPGATRLTQVNVRLFREDVVQIRALAEAQGLPWSIELRAIVHRALRGERREVVMLKEQP